MQTKTKTLLKCTFAAALLIAVAFAGAPQTDPAKTANLRQSSQGNVVTFHFLLDRSGSMSHLKSDVVGGFNAYVVEQQNDALKTPEDEVLLSLVQFDTEDPHEITVDHTPIGAVQPLDAADYVPRGGTPLYDAIGRMISRAESVRKPDELTTVIIFTDGEENSSREHTRDSINKLIDAKKKAGWQFLFMGANQDAFEEGGRIGMTRGSSQNYVADAGGVATAFSSLASASNSYREKARAAKKAMSELDMDAQEAAAFMTTFATTAAADFFEGNDDAQKDFEQRMITRTNGHGL